MNQINGQRAATWGLVAASALFGIRGMSAASDGAVVEVRGGTAIFNVATNIPAIGVHGKSSELDARATVRDGSDGLALDAVEARLPVKSLTTGMGLRDDHMRKLVFTNPDGSVPDITFSARAACAPANEASGPVHRVRRSIQGYSVHSMTLTSAGTAPASRCRRRRPQAEHAASISHRSSACARDDVKLPGFHGPAVEARTERAMAARLVRIAVPGTTDARCGAASRCRR